MARRIRGFDTAVQEDARSSRTPRARAGRLEIRQRDSRVLRPPQKRKTILDVGGSRTEPTEFQKGMYAGELDSAGGGL